MRALIEPNWSFHRSTYGDASVPSTTPGVSVAAGASSADGTAVTLLSALAADVEYLTVEVAGFTVANGSDNSALLSILYDPAGGTSWQTLIPYLDVGGAQATTGTGMFPRTFHFPLWVPAGASIGAMARAAVGASPPTGKVNLTCRGGRSNPGGWWAGQSVVALGAVAASSIGTAHTPGSSGTFSSFASIGTATDRAFGALQMAADGNGSTAMNSLAYGWQMGVGGAAVGPELFDMTGTSETVNMNSPGPIFCSIPQGAQMQIKGRCSGTAQARGVIIYGVS